MIQSSLHRRTVLHLLGQPAVAGTSQMLLLHGGSNAYCCGLLVLQHVSEALKAGGKKRKEVKEGDGIYRVGGGGRIPHQVISHYTDAAIKTSERDFLLHWPPLLFSLNGLTMQQISLFAFSMF